MEEEALTLPRSDPLGQMGRTVALAGIGALTIAGAKGAGMGDLCCQNDPSTGGNSAWLEKALIAWDPSRPTDLYSESLLRSRSLSGERVADPVIRSEKEALQHIKHALSLTAQQLAAVMGVSRAALYQWLGGSAEMRAKNRGRLRELEALAEEWIGRTGKPLNRISTFSREDRDRVVKCLVDGLEDDNRGAKATLGEIADRAEAGRPRHRSVLELAKERGWSDLPEELRGAELGHRLPSVATTSEED